MRHSVAWSGTRAAAAGVALQPIVSASTVGGGGVGGCPPPSASAPSSPLFGGSASTAAEDIMRASSFRAPSASALSAAAVGGFVGAGVPVVSSVPTEAEVNEAFSDYF